MTAVKVEVKEVKPEIAALSGEITKGLTVDSKVGTVVAQTDIYEKNLPEGLLMSTVDAVRDYNSVFVAAGAHAMGMVAVDAMKSNKELERLALDISMGGKDSVHYTVDRKRTTIDQMHNKGAEIVKYGVINTSLTVTAGKNSGQLKVARNQISQLAMAALVK